MSETQQWNRPAVIVPLVCVVLLATIVSAGVWWIKSIKDDFFTQLEEIRNDHKQSEAIAKDAVTVTAIKQRMRTIGMAMFYHADRDQNGRMLPQSDENWRVALGRSTNQFEPNSFKDSRNKTRILLLTGPGTFFENRKQGGGSNRQLSRTMRAAETIALAIAVGPDKAVPLSDPAEFVIDPQDPTAGLGSEIAYFQVLMADGSVKDFPTDMSPIAFKVLCQVYPQVEAKDFELIKSELTQLGLPSVLPQDRRMMKARFE